MRRTPCIFGLLLVGAVGCSETDQRPPVWDYISPAILQPNCATASCHSPAAAVAGLDFSDSRHGYTSLTKLWVWIVDPKGTAAMGCRKMHGVMVCQRPRRPLVNPYDPSQSRLMHMLRAEGAPRMPPDRPLPLADIKLVERWILDGALGPGGIAAPDAGAASDVKVDSKLDGASEGGAGEAGSGEAGDKGSDLSDGASG